MKIKVYEAPIKGGSILYVPEEPLAFTKGLGMVYAPEDPFAVTKAMARAYIQGARGGEGLTIEVLTAEKREEGGLQEKIKGGLLDTAYRDEKLFKEILNRLNQWYSSLHLTHWFFRFFLGPILVLGSFGRIAEIAAGLQLIFGRPWFAGKLTEASKGFFGEVSKGVEASYKEAGEIIQREDRRLKALKAIIDSCEDKFEAYKRAFHACDELGLPQLKNFYLNLMPMGEWKLQEPHMLFPLSHPEGGPGGREKLLKLRRARGAKPRADLDLFDYEVSAKELQAIKRFSELEGKLKEAAERAGFNEVAIYETETNKTVWAFEIGNEGADEVILIKAGTHGNEDASPRAALLMMRSLEKDGKLTKEVLDKAFISIIPCDDPEGFDIRNKMFVDMRGHEEHSPVQRGMVRYRDVNGVWGDHARSPRILAIQKYISEIKPTFAFDLHETVFGEAELWAKGAGILSIEDFYVPTELRDKFERMRVAPGNKASKLLSKLPFRREVLNMEYVRDVMKRHPAFEYGEAMMRHVKEKGLRTFSMEYQRLTMRPPPPIPPQLIFFDEGRCIDGPLLYDSEIRVCTSWLHDEFGTIAFTSETFPNPMDERVLEDLAYVEGGLMKRLKVGKYAG